MAKPLDQRLISFHATASIIAGGLTAVIGAVVILGYLLDNPYPKPSVAAVSMNPVTAILFILIGFSIIAISRAMPGAAMRRIGAACAVLSVAVAATVLSRYLTGHDTGIDNVLFADQLATQRASTGTTSYMRVLTAIDFTLIGISLALNYAKKNIKLSQLTSLAALAVAFGSTIWFLYALNGPKENANSAPMALATGLAFVVASIGALFVRPAEGFMSVVMSESTGGVLMRRVMPPLIILPIVFGFVTDLASDHGLGTEDMGLTLLVTVSVFVTLAAVWHLAFVLRHMDFDLRETKKRLEETLAEQEKFRQIAEVTDSIFFMLNAKGTEMLYISPGYEKIWGRTTESLYKHPQEWVEAVHPEDRQRMMEIMARQTLTSSSETFRIVQPSGDVRWISVKSFPVVDAAGVAYRIAGIAHDITEQKREELELVERNTQLKQTMSVTTGREIRMIELKGEIKRLKQENEDLRKK